MAMAMASRVKSSVVDPRPPVRMTSSARLILVSLLLLVACSPEVGSDAWCENMKETPKADWSLNDAAAFAKQCVFK